MFSYVPPSPTLRTILLFFEGIQILGEKANFPGTGSRWKKPEKFISYTLSHSVRLQFLSLCNEDGFS